MRTGLLTRGQILSILGLKPEFLGRICSQGAVNKLTGEGRGEGLEFWGFCVLWDQVRMGKAVGRNPVLSGEDEMDPHIVAGA